jgi:YggT family protein
LGSDVQFVEYWYYAVPNYLLAALMYSLLARFILAFFLQPDSPNYIYRFLRRITDPAVIVFGFLMPRAVPPLLVVLFTAVWLLIVRFAFYVAMAGAGLTPPVAS